MASTNRRRRTLLLLVLLPLLVTLALLAARERADMWIRGALEHAVRERGGTLDFDVFRLTLSRLEIEFEGLSLDLGATSRIPLDLEVDSGRVRLAWRGLAQLPAGRLHLAELRLTRPRLVLARENVAGGGTAAERTRPIDLRIDRFEAQDGRFSFADRVQRFDLAADRIALEADWATDRQELAGRVTLALELMHAPLARPLPLRVASGFRLRRHDVELEGLEAGTDGLELHADSTVRFWRKPVVTGHGEIEADMDRLRSYLEEDYPEVGGRLSGPVSWEYDTDGLRMRGEIEADRPRFGPFRASSASSNLHYKPALLELNDLRARMFDGVVQGAVEIGIADPSFRVEIEGRGVDARALLRWVGSPIPLDSDVDLHLSLGGDRTRRKSWEGRGDFSVTTRPDRPDGVAAEGRGEIELGGGQLLLRAPGVEVGGALLALELSLDVEQPQDGRLRFEGETSDAAETQAATLRVLDALDLSIPDLLRRRLAGRGPVTALIDLERDSLDLALELQDGRFDVQEFDRLGLALGLVGDRLTVGHLDLERGDTRVGGSGRFDVQPISVLELAVETHAVDLATLLDLAGLRVDLTGKLDAQIGLGGEDGRTGGGQVRLRDGELFGEVIAEARAEVEIREGRVRLENLQIEGPAAVVEGHAVWLPSRGEATVDIGSAMLRLGELRALAPLSGVEGILRLRGRLDQAAEGLSGKLEIEGDDWQVRGRVLGRVAGLVELADDGLSAHLAGDSASGWSARGKMGWEPPLPFEAEVELRSAPIELADWDPGSWSAEVTGGLSLAGELRDPGHIRATGRVEAAELRRGAAFLATDGPVLLRLQDQILTIEPMRLTGPGSRLEGHARYDLGLDRLEARAEGLLDLGVLTAPLATIRASGSVAVDLAAHGPLGEPSVTGSLRADSSRLRYLGFPQSLEQVVFDVELGQGEAKLRELRARLGNGEVHASGAARLEGLGFRSFEIHVDLANVRGVYPEGFRGVYEGEVVLRGGPDEVTLGGRLHLLRGIYDQAFDVGQLLGPTTREFDPTSESGPLEDLLLDLSLSADGNVWVRNDLAQIESSVDLHLGGSIRRPQVTGRVRTLDGGKLQFRKVEYDLLSGALDFIDIDRIDPYLTLRAQTTVKRYTVFLRVEGTLDRFEYELTSEPVLSTQDIIALLTSGNTLEELTASSGGGSAPFTGDLAANYFAGALTAPFEKQLGRLLGLDRVSINPRLIEGDADPTTRVTLGQEVTDDLTVIFSTDVGKSERQLYEIDWQATGNFHVSARRDTLGGIGGNLYYTNRFWWKKPVPEPETALPPAGSEAQTPTHRDRLASVLVRGASAADLEPLRQRIGLAVGDGFSRSGMFKGVEAIKRYYIGVDRIETRVDAETVMGADGVHVTYHIDPGPATVVLLRGATDKEGRRLQTLLEELWFESVFSEDLYDDSVERIEEFYRERGFYAVDVQVRSEMKTGTKEVRFEIDRGKPVAVEAVRLNGVDQVSDDRIRRQLLTRPSSGLSRRVLVPEVLDADVASIRTLYREEGFLDARVRPPRILLSTTSDSAEVELTIEEGSRYVVGAITFGGEHPFAEEELRSWSGLTVDQVYAPSALLQAESRIRTGIDGRGHPDVRVRGSVEPGGNRVLVHFNVDPGPQKVVAEIQIHGNNLTQEKIIRRELQLRPGDHISRAKVLATQHGLYRLGIFRNVRVTYRPVDPANATEQVLDVTVEEAAPLAVSVGIGYDTEARASTSLSLTHSNLGGYARGLSFQGKYSGLEKRLQLVGKEPRLFNHRLSALANLGWEETEEVGFTVARRTLSSRVEKRFNPKWTGYARYSFQRVELSDVVITPDELVAEKLVEGGLGDLGFAVVRDTRDDRFLTQSGSQLTAELRIFAEPFLSEATFVKSTVTGSVTRPLRRKSSVASSLRIGLAYPFGTDGAVPISEGFFAGGDSTIRGFPRDEVGPASGGSGLIIVNQEVRFPIWRVLKGVAFYDVGDVVEDASDLDLAQLRHVLGVGLRLETPIGPLRLEYGRKLDREPGESTGELFVAIGSAF